MPPQRNARPKEAGPTRAISIFAGPEGRRQRGFGVLHLARPHRVGVSGPACMTARDRQRAGSTCPCRHSKATPRRSLALDVHGVSGRSSSRGPSSTSQRSVTDGRRWRYSASPCQRALICGAFSCNGDLGPARACTLISAGPQRGLAPRTSLLTDTLSVCYVCGCIDFRISPE